MGGQSLRRGRNGGQGAAKAFGAVKMGVKMAQNGSKRLKIGPKWPTVGSKWVSIGLKWCHNGSARNSTGSTATQRAPRRTCRVQLENENGPDPGGLLRVREGGPARALENPMIFP